MKKHLLVVFAVFFIFSTLHTQTESDKTKYQECIASYNAIAAGKYDEAIIEAENCIIELLKSEDYESIVRIRIKRIATIYQFRNEFDKSNAESEKIIEFINENLNGESDYLGEVYGIMGFNYSMIGEIEKAVKTSKKGIDYYRNRKQQISLARALGSFSGMLMNLGRFEEAIVSGTEAVEIYKVNEAEVSAGLIGVTLLNLGMTHAGVNQFEEAVKILSEAEIYIEKQGGNTERYLPNSYQVLGDIYTSWGESETAIEYLQKGLQILNKINLSETVIAAVTHMSLGKVYAAIGRYEESSQQLKMALEKFSEDVLTSPTGAGLYGGISNSEFQKNNVKSALEFSLKASSVYRENELEESFAHQKLLLERVDILLLQKEYSKADSLLKKVDSILIDKKDSYKELKILAAWNTAEIHQATGQIELAQTEFKKAIALLCPGIFSSSDFDCVSGYQAKTMSIINEYGKFLYENGNETLLKEGLELCQKGIKLFEKRNRQNLNLKNKGRFLLSDLAFIGQKIATKLYQIDQADKTLESAFLFADYSKSLVLQNVLDASEALKYIEVSPEISNLKISLERKLFHNETLLSDAVKSNDSVEVARIRDEVIFDLKRQHEEVSSKVAETSNLAFIQTTLSASDNISNLSNQLKSGELFIEYSIDQASGELNVFTISKNETLQIKTKPLVENIEKQIQAFNQLLQKSTLARNTSREKFIRESHELYKQFLQPIEDQLVGKDRLIIIGDGMTNYIPFEVLLKSNEIKPFNELDFLVKNHEVSYHYSATLFAKAKEQKATESTGLYAFAPVYEETSESSVATRKTREIEMDSTLRAFNADGSFSPLPESEREVKSILNLFEKSGSKNNLLALKKDATEASLKSNLEKPFKYIHIAGHSFADLKNPKFSGIACFDQAELTEGKDLSAGAEDGTLYTGEIYNIASKADLVTLSSCESGFGKLEKTEGLLGLNRAFIYAGAPNVIFSLWKVYDKISAQMMVDFYKNTLDGKTYSASLRQAKLELLKKEETASPHFWSPFLLIGR